MLGVGQAFSELALTRGKEKEGRPYTSERQCMFCCGLRVKKSDMVHEIFIVEKQVQVLC